VLRHPETAAIHAAILHKLRKNLCLKLHFSLDTYGLVVSTSVYEQGGPTGNGSHGSRKSERSTFGASRRDVRSGSQGPAGIRSSADRRRVGSPSREEEWCPAMKIEFNGRAVASFVCGVVVGAVAALAIAAGPIGRIQIERDAAREDASILRQQLANSKADLQRMAVQQTPQTAPAAPRGAQDPAVQVLNAVRPGLGTAAAALAAAAQKAQAQKAAAQQALVVQQANSCDANSVWIPLLKQCVVCSPGLHAGTFPNGDAGCVQ